MSNDYRLEEAEQTHSDVVADQIATRAAKLVGSRDMSRSEAIKAATEEMRQEYAADNDVTGVAGTLIEETKPSKELTEHQLNAIKLELMDAAIEGAETL